MLKRMMGRRKMKKYEKGEREWEKILVNITINNNVLCITRTVPDSIVFQVI